VNRDKIPFSCRDNSALHVTIGLSWLTSVVLEVSREVQRRRFTKRNATVAMNIYGELSYLIGVVATVSLVVALPCLVLPIMPT
jgi:hypothetical protein